MVDESMELQTKLLHINIHFYWLRQEVQCGTINICWVLIKQIMVDGLTNTLTTGIHDIFIKMTGIEDQLEFFASIQKKKDLREFLQQSVPEISELFR